MNIQFLTGPQDRSIWASPALPGSMHEPGVARSQGVIDSLAHWAIA
ncbi:hypothetical protein [Actinomadura montaniterrae]|nr:hypothetical protein [Actinomadura montaniterrae]